MGVFLDLKKSIQRDLIAFSLTNLSDFQSVNLAGMPTPSTTDAGKTCYRSDEDKLYQLQADATENNKGWVEVGYDFFFVDFDDHAQIQELPNHHLVGTKAISVNVDEHMVEMGLLLVVSAFGDSNFQKHDVVVDALFSRYLPTKSINIYRSSDGAASGHFMVKNGTEVMPMAKADQRPVQFISVALATDRTVSLA